MVARWRGSDISTQRNSAKISAAAGAKLKDVFHGIDKERRIGRYWFLLLCLINSCQFVNLHTVIN